MNTAFVKYLSCLFLICSLVNANPPPSGLDLYEKLNNFWSKREFDKIEVYRKTITNTWKDSVTVELANGTCLYRRGAQNEDLIASLLKVENVLIKNREYYSPLYQEVLESNISRYRESLLFYNKKGITYDDRLKMFNPQNLPEGKVTKQWGFEILLKLTPNVTFDGNNVILKKYYRYESALSLTDSEIDIYINNLKDDSESIDKKLESVYRLRGNVNEDLGELYVQILKSNNILLFEAVSDNLQYYGSDLNPRLVGLLKDEQLDSINKKFIIWIICRQGDEYFNIVKSTLNEIDNDLNVDLLEYFENYISSE